MPPKQPVFEPWRQREVEAAQKRARLKHEQNLPISQSASNNTPSCQHTEIRSNDEVLTQSTTPRLAQRRRNKLAPALKLTVPGEQADPRGQRPKWRVLKENEVDGTDSLRPGWKPQPRLRPEKVGDDLFLNVSY